LARFDAQRLANGVWYDDLELPVCKYRFQITIPRSTRKAQHEGVPVRFAAFVAVSFAGAGSIRA